jgi:hypothetical protein
VDGPVCGILPPMAGRRRGVQDSLQSVNVHRWLVVRDRTSHALDYRELAPYSDLRAAMAAERARMTADGWSCGDTPRNCSFFFTDRDEERVCVSVDCVERGRGARRGGVSGREGGSYAHAYTNE